MARTGRPPIDEKLRKSVKYSIRLDEKTEAKLNEYCEKRGITKGEAIRRGIDLLLKKKK